MLSFAAGLFILTRIMVTRRTTVNTQYVKYNFPLCMSSLYNMIVINLHNISVEIKIMRRDVLQ